MTLAAGQYTNSVFAISALGSLWTTDYTDAMRVELLQCPPYTPGDGGRSCIESGRAGSRVRGRIIGRKWASSTLITSRLNIPAAENYNNVN